MAGLLIALCAQVVLTFDVDGDGPVRFGFPVPAAAIDRGLRLDGCHDAKMQWSLLQTAPGLDIERVWAEIAVIGQRGRARILLGGARASGGEGPVLSTHAEVERDLECESRRVEWRWCDGTVESTVRRLALVDSARGPAGDVEFRADPAWLERRTRVHIGADAWRTVGVLPRADRSGVAWRAELRDAFARLPRAPGRRGQGDYVRGPQHEIVTNLEFDTTLGLCRLALCNDDRVMLGAAWDAARHLVDIDLDLRSGLPHCHGKDHDSARPEPGHVWLGGLLLVGCVFADRGLCESAMSIGAVLAGQAQNRERPVGAKDRMRDEAWPLYEIEGLLRFADLAPLRSGADAVAAAMLRRFDAARDVFRYGEAETRSEEVVRDRLWLTLGIALPALRRSAERTGDPELREVIDRLDRRASAVLLQGGRGVPLQAVVGPDGPFDTVRVEGAAESFLLLDGIDEGLRRRVLARSMIRDALEGALGPGHHDLATRFSIVARCTWVMR